MRRYFVILSLIFASIGVQAQDAAEGLTAGKCLGDAPTTIFTLIDNMTRLDMLDYYRAGVSRSSTNALGGECFVMSEAPYSVEIQGGTDTKYQLFVLNPTTARPIIGVIETVATPIDDSAVTFYDSRWRKVTPELLPEPTLADWIKKDAVKQRANVEERIPFIMASYSYNPDTQQLTITNNMAQYYTAYDVPQALEHLKDKLVYNWDGKKFKLQK